MSSPSAQSLKERCRGISAGIFAAPLGSLSYSAHSLAEWGVNMLHFDVMDGAFVPQITGGAGFVAALGDNLVRDVHLMVSRPGDHVGAFAGAGADIITVHAEAPGASEALALVRQASADLKRPILAGLAVMPGTPLEQIVPLLDPMPDLVLVLALDPRDGRPADVPAAAERLQRLREATAPHQTLLGIDGGVTQATVNQAAAAGPDFVVSGSAIFRAADPEAACHDLSAAISAGNGEARRVS